MHRTSIRRPIVPRAAIPLALVGSLVWGCSPGIQWRGYTFDQVHADSRRDGKVTFVYFRHWAEVACTEFEESVLKDPAVRHALRPDGPLYAAALDFRWDRPLATQWGIDAPPGVVILDADGRVLATLTGKITVEQLLEAIKAALPASATDQAPTGSGP